MAVKADSVALLPSQNISRMKRLGICFVLRRPQLVGLNPRMHPATHVVLVFNQALHPATRVMVVNRAKHPQWELPDILEKFHVEVVVVFNQDLNTQRQGRQLGQASPRSQPSPVITPRNVERNHHQVMQRRLRGSASPSLQGLQVIMQEIKNQRAHERVIAAENRQLQEAVAAENRQLSYEGCESNRKMVTQGSGKLVNRLAQMAFGLDLQQDCSGGNTLEGDNKKDDNTQARKRTLEKGSEEPGARLSDGDQEEDTCSDDDDSSIKIQAPKQSSEEGSDKPKAKQARFSVEGTVTITIDTGDATTTTCTTTDTSSSETVSPPPSKTTAVVKLEMTGQCEYY